MKHTKGWVSTPQPHYHCTLIYKTCQTHNIYSSKSLSLSLQHPQHHLDFNRYKPLWHYGKEFICPAMYWMEAVDQDFAVPTLLTSVAMMHSSFSSDMTYTDWYFVSFEVEYTESGRFLSEVSLLKAKRERTSQMAVP